MVWANAGEAAIAASSARERKRDMAAPSEARASRGRCGQCSTSVPPADTAGNDGGVLPETVRSKLGEHRLRAGHLEFPGRLDVERLHHAVLHKHRVALRAYAHVARGEVELQPELLRVVAVAVGHHPNLAARFLVATPRRHDEGVVDRDAP